MTRADQLIFGSFHGKIPDLLLEGRLDFLAKKYVGVSTAHDTLGQHKTPEDIINHFATKSDPTPNKQYTDRIMHWYSKGQIRQEDHQRVHAAVSAFHIQKARLPEKDLGRYQSIHDLERAVGKLKPPKEKVPWASTEKEQASVRRGSKKLLDTPTFTAREVTTHPAMKALGSNTHWCTVPSKDYFKRYKSNGPLIHIHDKTDGERYLVHAESGQFKGVDDREISKTNLNTLIDRHPDLLHVKGVTRYAGANLDSEHLDNAVSAGHLKNIDFARGVANNPLTTTHMADEAAHHHLLGDSGTAKSFPLDLFKKVSAGTIEKIYDKYKDIPALVKNLPAAHTAPGHILHKVAEHIIAANIGYPSGASAVVNHSNVNPETLDLLAGRDDALDTDIMRHPKANAHTLDKLLAKHDAEGYSYHTNTIARHPNLSPSTHQKLLHHRDHVIVNSALNNPQTTVEHLRGAVRRSEPSEYGYMAKHIDRLRDLESSKILYDKELSSHGESGNRTGLNNSFVQHAVVHPDVLHAIAQDPHTNSYTHQLLAQHPNVRPDTEAISYKVVQAHLKGAGSIW